MITDQEFGDVMGVATLGSASQRVEFVNLGALYDAFTNHIGDLR